MYSDIPEYKSLTAAVILLAHTPEFITALEFSIESKCESAPDLEQCIAQVKYFIRFVLLSLAFVQSLISVLYTEVTRI